MKILNEINYFILCIALNFLETKNRWSIVTEKCYLYLMMSISVQITILSLIDLIITVIQKYRIWKNKVKPKITVNKALPRVIEVDLNAPDSVAIESLSKLHLPSSTNEKQSSLFSFHPKEDYPSRFYLRSNEEQKEIAMRYLNTKF